jgi:hypothetical protein
VQKADCGIECCELGELRQANRQDAADQDFLYVLRPLRRAIDNQYGCCRCDDVQDANEGLLADEAGESAGHGEQCGPDRGEQQSVAKSCDARRRIAVRKGEGSAQRRELRERQIRKDNIPAQHMNAEIGMNENEGDAGRERKQEERERITQSAHWRGAPNALASAATS